MHSKEIRNQPRVSGLTSRREVLRRGAAVAAVSFIAPVWTRLARASTPSTFDYYISPSGSDSNPGTLQAPWTLNALNTKGATYAGKSVGIVGDQGTYNCLKIYLAANGGSTLGDPNTNGANAPAFNIASGTSGSPTVVASCNSSGDYSPGLAILDGGSTSLSQSASVNPGGNPLIGAFPNAAYVTIDGFVLQNNYYRYIHCGYTPGANGITTRSPGITVQNCHFGGTGTLYNQIANENPTYLTLYATQGALVQNNLMDGAINDSSNRSTGVEQWASIDSIIQYNTIKSPSACLTGGIFIKNANNNNNTIRYNYVDLTAAGSNNAGSGGICIDDDATSASASTDYIYNNIVIADNPVFWSAINVAAWPNYAHREIWHNNTFLGTPATSGGTFWVRFAAPGNITFYNNILYASSQSNFRGMLNSNDGPTPGTGSFALIDYNLYSPLAVSMSTYVANGSIPPVPTVVSTFAAWQAQLPSAAVGKDAHSVATAPRFVGGSPSYPAQYYQLASGSAGQGGGSSNGQTSGSAVDMGAWGGVDVNTGKPIAQIGYMPAGGSSAVAEPKAPVLSVS